MKEEYVVDRIEGDKLVLASEKGQKIISRKEIPGVKEGDIIVNGKVVKDHGEKRQKVNKLLGEIFKNKS